MGRIVDVAARRRKLLRDRECRVPDCGRLAVDPHHVVYRGAFLGDDVEENIVGLCREHHDLIHSGRGEQTRRELGSGLSDEEIGYALRRLGPNEGADLLRRVYFVPEERLTGGT